MNSGLYDDERLVEWNVSREKLFSEILDRFNIMLRVRAITGGLWGSNVSEILETRRTSETRWGLSVKGNLQ